MKPSLLDIVDAIALVIMESGVHALRHRYCDLLGSLIKASLLLRLAFSVHTITGARRRGMLQPKSGN